MWKTLM